MLQRKVMSIIWKSTHLEFTCFDHFDAAILSRVSSWRRRFRWNLIFQFFFTATQKSTGLCTRKPKCVCLFVCFRIVLEIRNDNVDVDHFLHCALCASRITKTTNQKKKRTTKMTRRRTRDLRHLLMWLLFIIDTFVAVSCCSFWGIRRHWTDGKWERREWPSAGLNARTVHTATDRRRVPTSPPPTAISLCVALCSPSFLLLFSLSLSLSQMKNIWKIEEEEKKKMGKKFRFSVCTRQKWVGTFRCCPLEVPKIPVVCAAGNVQRNGQTFSFIFPIQS